MCINILHTYYSHLLPVVPFFIFAVITSFFPINVFKAWSRFAIIWLVLSIIAIAFTPEYSGDFIFPIVKGSVAAGLSVLFLIISTILVLVTTLRKKTT